MNNAEELLRCRFENKKVALLGAGVSNRPLVGFLSSFGAEVEVRDKKSREALGADADFFESVGARLVLGDCYLENIDADFVFRSPGFRPDMPALCKARENGAKITSETEQFLEVSSAFVIGVTGSDGKSTTTTLVSKILEHSCKGERDVYLGGNIGTPLLDRVGLMSEKSLVAAELSSFQLMSVSSPVDVAVITNITPNHLNWHTDMREYIDAKARILNGAKRAVLNFGNSITRELGRTCGCPVTYFTASFENTASAGGILDEISEKDSLICLEDGSIVKYVKRTGERRVIMKRSDILLPGLHNTENYMAAAAAAEDFAGDEDVSAVAGTFGGVRHRLELVGRVGGVYYYNSSIDSSPTRTAAALSAITDKPIHIICGGYDKQIPFEPLAEALARCPNLKSVTLTGATAEKILASINSCEPFDKEALPVETVPDFREAVLAAASKAEDGDAVLLSPACASFDAFANFEERGDFFRKLIEEMK